MIIIDLIRANSINCLAIIGMAKNAGKTVAFNTIVKEAVGKGIRLGLVSYGRDGEEIDAITRQEKPRIQIPPDTLFASASEALAKSDLQAEILHRTGINTLLGEVHVYRTGKEGGQVELVGVNSVSQLKVIRKLFSGMIDLMLIDGAFNRRSSAIPSLADGLILATGAVVGNTETLVVQKTLQAIDMLSWPVVTDPALRRKCREILAKGGNGVVDHSGNHTVLSARIGLAAAGGFAGINPSAIQAIVVNGALIDSFAEQLVLSFGLKDCKLILRDQAKAFLQRRTLTLLRRAGIEIQVMDAVKLVAVSVNPVSPYGIKLDSSIIVAELTADLRGEVPVYDLLGEEYLSIEG